MLDRNPDHLSTSMYSLYSSPILVSTRESLPVIPWLIPADSVPHPNDNTNHGHDQAPVQFDQAIPMPFTTTSSGKIIEGFISDGTVNFQQMSDEMYV